MSALKHKDTAVLTANRVKIIEKIRESAISVLPIVVIVLVLCLTIAPVGTDLLLCFLIGTIFVVVGMGLFSLGAEASMTPIGNRIGMALTKTRNLPLILIVSFMLGFAVTIAEPDLQVLAETVPHINNTILLVTVGIGVGFFPFRMHAAHRYRRKAALAAYCFLRCSVYLGQLCRTRFP